MNCGLVLSDRPTSELEKTNAMDLTDLLSRKSLKGLRSGLPRHLVAEEGIEARATSFRLNRLRSKEMRGELARAESRAEEGRSTGFEMKFRPGRSLPVL